MTLVSEPRRGRCGTDYKIEKNAKVSDGGIGVRARARVCEMSYVTAYNECNDRSFERHTSLSITMESTSTLTSVEI